MYRKKGAPKKAVTKPTGISAGLAIVLANKSAIKRNIAPIIPAIGIRNLLSGPQSNRIIWGATKPINPINPPIKVGSYL